MKPKREQEAVRDILVKVSFVVFFLIRDGQSISYVKNRNEITDKLHPYERFPTVLPSLLRLSGSTIFGIDENLFHESKIRSPVSRTDTEFRGERMRNFKTPDVFETHPPILKRHWNKFLKRHWNKFLKRHWKNFLKRHWNKFLKRPWNKFVKSIGVRSHAYSRSQSKYGSAHNESAKHYKSDLYFERRGKNFHIEHKDPSFNFISFIEHFFDNLKDSGFYANTEALQGDFIEITQRSGPVKPLVDHINSTVGNKDRELVLLDHEVSTHFVPSGKEMRLQPLSKREEAEWAANHQNLSRKKRQKLSSTDISKEEGRFVRPKRRHKHRHRPRITGSVLAESNLRKGEKFSDKFFLKSDSPSYVITSASEMKKDWCRTVPLRQKVSERNCRPKVMMNNFCYGQCNSFFIPHPWKTGSHSAFQSCAFCKPHRPKWINVTLHCPGQNPPKKEKTVFVVESCRCITEVFQ